MTLKFGKYRITTIQGFDDALRDAGWTVRKYQVLSIKFLVYWKDDEWERVMCDVCGDVISKRKQDKGFVHILPNGRTYVHWQHVIEDIMG